MLTQTLRRLERDGLVTREVFAEVPPRVVYSLTPMGESLIKPITAVSDWAEEHMPAITTAQQQYDAPLNRTSIKLRAGHRLSVPRCSTFLVSAPGHHSSDRYLNEMGG